MTSTLRFFTVSLIFWAIGLIAAYAWGGFHALWLAALLSILEVTLSFDNAVVNARILKRMNEVWQQRFLTWGILVAVVGTRLVLPILIVAASVSLSPLLVATLALNDPHAYGELLEGAHIAIASFGGTFLLMVALKYFIDSGKETHWLRVIEQHVAKWGRIEALEIGIALMMLLLVSWLAPHDGETVLFAGILGIVLFIAMQGIAGSFSLEASAAGSFALFIYLNIIDAAFSLDGVVGAFALTSDLPIIVIGLGVGAYFVRSLTVYMVRRKTLDTLTYLEHGAHWAIFGLAASMLTTIFIDVPEVVTGLVGIVFVSASYVSSLRARRAHTV